MDVVFEHPHTSPFRQSKSSSNEQQYTINQLVTLNFLPYKSRQRNYRVTELTSNEYLDEEELDHMNLSGKMPRPVVLDRAQKLPS